MSLIEIEQQDARLYRHFEDRFVTQPALTRPLVSFQANKTRPMYRWYKYKEGFSAALVEHLFRKYGVTQGRVLDPFAGSGTTLFVSSEMGMDADGIELLPIGHEIINTRKFLLSGLEPQELDRLRWWKSAQPWRQNETRASLTTLRITRGAYPEQTADAIERYLGACQQEQERVQAVLRFALLCVLEAASYTRKDGQYLRWDYRSGRKQGKKPFNKGEIDSFEQAIDIKLEEIISDLSPTAWQMTLFSANPEGSIRLYEASCLDTLPALPQASYDAIMTSPPYCNRYDYTRTYALELALLGVDEPGLRRLRQEMLSCTVENRAKDLVGQHPEWTTAVAAADGQGLLQEILRYLDGQKAEGVLNNNGIPRMVRGYFYEMACVIYECARVLRAGAPLFMVNDNVRYAGASISVDMILSHIAEQLGFRVESILVLPTGKGNSSQQMGLHGREALRKCVYIWRKQ